MTKQIKISDAAYNIIIRHKADLIVKKGKNVSLVDVVDYILKIKEGNGK